MADCSDDLWHYPVAGLVGFCAIEISLELSNCSGSGLFLFLSDIFSGLNIKCNAKLRLDLEHGPCIARKKVVK